MKHNVRVYVILNITQKTVGNSYWLLVMMDSMGSSFAAARCSLLVILCHLDS